jgi:hypothetical protein
MKKNPPYLKNFCAIPGQLPICTLYAGPFAWAGAKEHNPATRSTVIVLPPDELPSSYRWGFLDDWIVWVKVKGPMAEKTIDALSVELLSYGAIIVVFQFEPYQPTVFRRTVDTNRRLNSLFEPLIGKDKCNEIF